MAEKWVYSKLSNDSDVAALVSTRIYPDRATPAPTLPYIVYWLVNSEPWQAGDGYSGACRDQWSFECYAATRIAANTLRNKVRIAMDHATESTVSSQTVLGATYTGKDDAVEQHTQGAAEPAYMASVDFDLFVSEATS